MAVKYPTVAFICRCIWCYPAPDSAHSSSYSFSRLGPVHSLICGSRNGPEGNEQHFGPTKRRAGCASITPSVWVPQAKLLVLPASLESRPDNGWENPSIIALIHLLMETLEVHVLFYMLHNIFNWHTHTQPQKNPRNPTLSHLERLLLLLSCRLLNCTTDLLVSSEQVYCLRVSI